MALEITKVTDSLMNMVTSPTNLQTRVFERSITLKSTLEALTAFHNDPKVFGKLAPPPIFIQVRQDDRQSLTEGDLKFTLWFLFVPITWHARHEAGPTPHSFADRMIAGPMAYWRHEHIFTEVEGGVKLTDRVTLAHKSGLAGLLSRLMFDGLPLQMLFFYRHLRTRMALER